MKLTPNILAMYLGCQMRYATHHEPQNETYTLTVKNIYEAVAFGDTPILRRLEDMTEEEARDIWAIPDDWKIFMRSYGVFCQLGTNDSQYIDFKSLSPNAFQRLLSKCFDLYGGIDAGWAVDAKQIKQ